MGFGPVNKTKVNRGVRAVRRSSLDPCELIPAIDEVWTAGICAKDAWQWRPYFDIFVTLLGLEIVTRIYVLEQGGPAANYARAICDVKSFLNDDRTSTASVS